MKKKLLLKASTLGSVPLEILKLFFNTSKQQINH